MNSPVTRAVERRIALENTGRGDIMRHWPDDPYRFGDELAAAAKSIITASSSLRESRSFIEDVMRAILHEARAAGVVFEPEIDVVVLDSGAAHVTDYTEGWGRHWQTSDDVGDSREV